MLNQNPFPGRDGWWWRDANGAVWGPHATQTDALRDLLASYDNRSWWQRLGALFMELVRA